MVIVDTELAARYRREGWWGDVTVSDLVATWAAERPDADAYVTPHDRMSWRQYDRRASALAIRLVELGLQPGQRVAVWLPDGPGVHVAFVALERAGLVAVGLGARAGDRELRHLLARIGAVALVTHEVHRGRDVAPLFESLRGELDHLRHHVVVDDQPVSDANASDPFPHRRLGPDDVFMINSTSGTTGMPKCVVHTQNRWMYFHRKAVEHGELGRHGPEVIMGAVPAPFGFGLWTSHFTPSVLGVTTVVMETFDADLATDLIERHRVTMLCCVSTQFVMLLSSPRFANADLSSLRVMFTGGEAIPFERAAAFEERTGAAVLQFFGSNETGLLTGTTLQDSREKRLRTAGRPVAEMQVRLYDGDVDVTTTGRGQPAGKGPATCLGYLDDPEANGALFTSDGWMLMGDICTIDDEGYLSVVGRTADIIIRGGKNISAAVVEDEVSSHPAVVLAAAVAVPDPVFGERVCVFVELRRGATLTLDELIAHLTSRGTSKELFPERFEVLDELPRSSGSKVAKGELRARVGGLTA